jgi:ATP-binding cassette, subfamily B, bacterial
MPYRRAKKEESLSSRQMLAAVWHVLKLSFRIAPSSIAFKVVSGLLDAILPLVTAYLAAETVTQITEAFNGVPGARSQAITLVGLTALVGLLATLKNSLNSYIDQIVRFRIESRISDMLYERFVRLDFWRYDDKETTDLYDKAQDFTGFFAYVFDRIARLFTSIFGVVSAILALSIITPWLSLAMFIAVIPGMLVQYRISRFQVKHWRENVTARRKQGFIEYNMMRPETISELRLYNLTRTLLDLRKKLRDKDQGARLAFERRFLKWRALSDLIESTVQLGSLLWVVIKISERVLPIGQFIYVQQLVGNALSSAGTFITEYGSVDEDLAKLKDYNDFMALPLQTEGLGTIDEIRKVQFKNVGFRYPHTEKDVLKDINLSFEAGDHIALVGENGAGKSTLIKLLLGFYEPTTGEILVNDKPLKSYEIASWHRKIGVLVQNFTSYVFLTLRENITFGDVTAKQSDERVDQALTAAQAHEVVNSTPQGLDTPMSTWFDEEGGTQLSGGQWQRVALARNFYRQAPLILLDEPTSAIDALAEAKIFDRLFDKSNKNTLLAISHRLTTIENADCIYVLEKGKIVQVGTHKELASQKTGTYVKMFRRQLRNDQ